jgi:subtilisin family serine protease
VAILDTGLDLPHPDFQDGRVVAATSFVGPTAQDRNGHGTHCAGTACGTSLPQGGRRYGVATGAKIFIGKVLRDDGNGVEGPILQGIEWAIRQGCRVASMSLEMETNGQVIQDYVDLGDRALAANLLIVAAAGNGSRRSQGFTHPVSAPANSSTIMAIGAVDRFLRIANFSNGTVPGTAGAVDLVGPGVEVYSSWSQSALPQHGAPPAGLYATISGTSMATPHVAGLAALIAQAHPEYDAADVQKALLMLARALPLPSSDVGKGLARAPRNER